MAIVAGDTGHLAAHNALASGHILLQGSAAQHKKVFPRLANGEWVGAWALTEPEAGSEIIKGSDDLMALPACFDGTIAQCEKITLDRILALLVVISQIGIRLGYHAAASSFTGMNPSNAAGFRKLATTCGLYGIVRITRDVF